MPTSKPVRRVVTGHDAAGKAVFASDEMVGALTFALLPGFSVHRLWGADAAPTFPDSGTEPAHATYFPPLDGFRFAFFTLPPQGQRRPDGLDLAEALADVDAALPGMLSYNEADEPGMHTTPTVDFEVVLSGECVLELDDGAEVVLTTGDTVVQNGTRHRWHNRSDAPCQLAVFLAGAHHERFGT